MPDHEQQEDETPPLCLSEEPSSPVALSLRQKRFPSLLPLVLIGVLLCIGSDRLSIARGAAYPGAPISTAGGAFLTRQQVIAKDQPSVVEVIGADCQDQLKGYGSGEIVDQRGYIVTNYHVVDGVQKFYVLLFDNSRLPAQLIGVDPVDDLAVLKINTPKHLSAIPFGDSSHLQVGDSSLAIGYPVPYAINDISSIGKIDGSTVTGGLISALGRQQPGTVGGVITDAIQTDTEINPGNSGGALVNMQAQLIGIPTQGPAYEDTGVKVITPDNRPIKGIGFAIPSNRIAFVTSQLIQYGKMVHTGHATIKATLVSVTPALALLDGLAVDHGGYLSDVDPGGPAALAGLQTGDVIVRVNNVPLTNALDITDTLMPIDAGTTVTLDVVRGTQQMQVKVKLQELPTNVQTTPIQHCPSTGTSVVGKG